MIQTVPTTTDQHSAPCSQLTVKQGPQKSEYPTSQPISGLPTDLSIKFWGVRGSVPTPIAANQRYGGNTACVEVKINDQRIIFDGGTGLVELGWHLHNESQHTQEPITAHLFFTHTQWDRIQGFPFFQPAFTAGNQFSVYGGTAPNGASIKHCLTDQMLQPHFSMPLQHMKAGLDFRPLSEKESVYIGDIRIDTILINSVTQAFGYRLTYKGYTLVYATDTPTGHVSLPFLEFAAGADLLIYDGTYCDLSYLKGTNSPEGFRPWETGVDIAKQANIKALALLHHSPVQDDDLLDQLQCDIESRFASAKVAYEGMIIER